MRGVTFPGERKVAILDFPDPEPGPGEVVLAMKASGMCGSDLHQYRRSSSGAAATGLPVSADPVIVGHEPAGEVVAVGAGVDRRVARVGQRAMVYHYQGCNACSHCHSGWMQLCQEVPVKVY
ncbi:MAG: alcohol dehydrogenase catalytic domain-containing protein, partial [Janthinobacterium lividum]